MSFSASYDFSLLLPQSTTYTTSSIVMEVSAMFVARITLRAPPRPVEDLALVRGRHLPVQRQDQEP